MFQGLDPRHTLHTLGRAPHAVVAAFLKAQIDPQDIAGELETLTQVAEAPALRGHPTVFVGALLHLAIDQARNGTLAPWWERQGGGDAVEDFHATNGKFPNHASLIGHSVAASGGGVLVKTVDEVGRRAVACPVVRLGDLIIERKFEKLAVLVEYVTDERG